MINELSAVFRFTLRTPFPNHTCEIFRTGKNDDIRNPSGGASAGIYDGFSETQTESQVSALTHLAFFGLFALLEKSVHLMCSNLFQKKKSLVC